MNIFHHSICRLNDNDSSSILTLLNSYLFLIMFKTCAHISHSSSLSWVGEEVCINVYEGFLTHCGQVTQICFFNTVKLSTSASSP